MDKSQCDVLTRFDSDDSPEDAECAAAEEKALTDILQKLAFEDFTSLQKGVFSDDDLCDCDSCKERKAWASECLEELKIVQSYWLELRQYVRIIYRLAMKNSLKSVDENYHKYMKDVVSRLCEVCDPHQLYQRLEAQVREFVIEIKVRLLQLMEKLSDKPQLPLLFISGMLDRYNKLMNAAAEVTPVLSQLETEHLSKFKLTWKLLNQRLFQTSIYTDTFFQNSVPLFITQLGKVRDHEESTALVHEFLKFDDEVTVVEGLWKEVASHIHQYSQENASTLARHKLLKDDWHEIKLLRLRPKICNNNKMLICKELNSNRHLDEENSIEEISLGTEDVCECHVCLELVSSHASIELMDQIFSPALHGGGFHLHPRFHSPGKGSEVTCLDHCGETESNDESIQLTIDFESKFPPKEGTEYTIPKQGTTNQKRVDKATQKDQDVQSYERETVKAQVKKKSIGTDTTSVKDAGTDSHCAHACNHINKHSDKIKRISCSDRTDSTDHVRNDINADSKMQQCDCCYCEVFGHGMPPTAPMSRNYMEMRERLRFILSKKRTNCKGSSNVSLENHHINDKKGQSKSQNASDTRNLDELLDFIEGNEAKCRNEKKAAKKARQKEKKIQLMKKKDEEEKAQQLYKEALAQAELQKIAESNKKKTQTNTLSGNKNVKSQPSKKNTSSDSTPQMVTIKRIMDSNNAEPTVTITLRGATPNQDRVLYTLFNGQVCEVKESKKNHQSKTPPCNVSKVSNISEDIKAPVPVPSSSSSKPSKKEKKQKKETPKNIDSFKLPENSSNEVTKSNCPTKCNAVSNPPASQINNVVNRVPKNDSKSFKIEDLKLPPGITITKVDPCTVKSKVPMKDKNSKPVPSGSPSNQNNSSEVIVVATGNLKDHSQQLTNVNCTADNHGNNMNNSKKKKNKKKNDVIHINALNRQVNGYDELAVEPELPLREKNDKQNAVTISFNSNLCTKYRTKKESPRPVATTEDCKKKKKKGKNNAIYDINSDEWRSLESVFAPKDIDLENGDIDDDERELEAFKRFCSQSVPPKRKEKVHFNIKDIILKKKSMALNEN